MESAIGRLRARKKLSYNPQHADSLEVPERRVLRILSRLKQQNYGEVPWQGWASRALATLPAFSRSPHSQTQGAEWLLGSPY
jgi:hypothetical protein